MTINQELPEVIRTSEIASLAGSFQRPGIAVPSAPAAEISDPLADIEKFFQYVDAFINRFETIGRQIREMRGIEQQTPAYQESGYAKAPPTPPPPRPDSPYGTPIGNRSVNAEGLFQSMMQLMQQMPKETTVGEAVEYAEKNRQMIVAMMQNELDKAR